MAPAATAPDVRHARHFSRAGDDGTGGIEFVRRDVRIHDADGSTVFAADGIEVPAAWSQLATDILASKYLHRPHETGARQAVARIVAAIARAGGRQGVLAGEAEEAFAAELTHILLTQKAAFNSPVWFNVGLHESYGVRGGDGQHVFEGGHVRRVEDGYERPQASACFIQGLKDNLTGPDGIFDLLRREAHIFRHGSGTGTNFSGLRSRHERIERGGTSSGVLSFLRVFDAAAGATKSGGTTRRAAKMVVLDADHPEVFEFVDWKRLEEEKAQALIAAGYPSDWEGEAYASVSGQHGNNSVRVPGAFMQAVEGNVDWQTRKRTDGEVVERFPARRLFDRIAEAAWVCGDPGLQFADTIAGWHTCPSSGPIHATNPCSEFVFLDDTACNLASINLMAYWDGQRFDVEGFRHTVSLLVSAMDILVDHAGYPTPQIARNSVRFRPLGLGYANLGALAMVQGWPYDSDEARGMAAAVTSLLGGAAYEASADLARTRGPLPGAADSDGTRTNVQHMQAVIDRHLDAARRVAASGSPHADVPARVTPAWRPVALAGVRAWATAAAAGTWRNAQVTAIAPTGTIGLLMDCDTTGIEPELSLRKRKRLAGGGTARLANRSIEAALQHLGYPPDAIASIVASIDARGDAEGSDVQAEHLAVFDTAFPSSPGGRSIAPRGHLLMMAAVQPALSGGISKTVNLPHDASVEDVARLYLEAWRLGLKSIATYRDRSKASQPLTGSQDVPPCPECHHPTERAGSCFRCTNCGTVLGCS